MTEPRRIDVFFYGLFMDEALLRSKGISPTNIRSASVAGLSPRIGRRATLVPDPKGRSYGMLMQLTHEEIDRLYSDPSVAAYRPEAVEAELSDGSRLAALCFNLPIPPEQKESNLDYATKLRDLARRLGFPSHYVDTIDTADQ